MVSQGSSIEAVNDGLMLPLIRISISQDDNFDQYEEDCLKMSWNETFC